MTWLDINDPVFQSVVLPFPVAAFLVGLIYKLVGGPKGFQFAVCGVAGAILLVYVLIFSWPDFPPRAANQKLGFLIGLSLAFSVVLVLWPSQVWLKRSSVVALVLGGVLWIAESKLGQAQYLLVFGTLICAAVVLVILLQTLDKAGVIGVTSMVVSVTLAGVAFWASSASVAQLALAIGVATAGYLVWTWPRPQLAFAESGLIAIAAPLIWLGSQAALYTEAKGWVLILVAVTTVAPMLMARLFRNANFATDAVRPVVTGCLAAMISVIALLAAYIGRPEDSGYGG
jgi:hypothetical protein